MSDKISKYKSELKALTEQNKENERRAKSEQMKQKQLNDGIWKISITKTHNRLHQAENLQRWDNLKLYLAREKLNQMKKQKVDMVKQMKEEAKQRQEKEKEVLKSLIVIL